MTRSVQGQSEQLRKDIRTEMEGVATEIVVMCVPFGRPTSRWQRPGRHNWVVMGELTILYI